jgi:hypothetical protein
VPYIYQSRRITPSQKRQNRQQSFKTQKTHIAQRHYTNLGGLAIKLLLLSSRERSGRVLLYGLVGLTKMLQNTVSIIIRYSSQMAPYEVALTNALTISLIQTFPLGLPSESELAYPKCTEKNQCPGTIYPKRKYDQWKKHRYFPIPCSLYNISIKILFTIT